MELIWKAVAQHISEASGAAFAIRSQQGVGGGCINATTVLQDGGHRMMVQTAIRRCRSW